MRQNSSLTRHLSCFSLCIFFTIPGTAWAEASERSRLGTDENTSVIAALEQKLASFKSDGVARNSGLQVLDGLNVLEPDPPELCMGHGELNSISLTDWETGLEPWTVGTHDISDSKVFATPDWAVVGSLPDGRTGMAAFVANLDIGDCEADDQTGALTLDSPPILIPAGTLVPRISVDHWVATEFQFDGGNIKISVNGGGFTLIPASAIDFNPYNSTLTSAIDGNTNPLAGEDAFTGTDDGESSGSWGQSHVRLLGIAEAEDTIQLRFDFGVDGCHGVFGSNEPVGWYVDDVEVYSCSAELLPSDCGNGAIDGEEQCDDGNTFIDDGCSNICEIDEGWQCIGHSRPGVILDPSFEAGTPNNPYWAEASSNFGSPICDETDCTTGTGSGPVDGLYWAWFGGEPTNPEEASLAQSVVFPLMATELQFQFEVSACDSASDYFEVLIDGNQELLIDGTSPLCWIIGYATQSVDITAYADGESHNVEFHAETFAVNSAVSNFFVDTVSIPGNASICTKKNTNLIIFSDGFEPN